MGDVRVTQADDSLLWLRKAVVLQDYATVCEELNGLAADAPAVRAVAERCRQRAESSAVQTLDESEEASERDARISVNAQLHRRRTGGGAVPLDVFLDDRLPSRRDPRLSSDPDLIC